MDDLLTGWLATGTPGFEGTRPVGANVFMFEGTRPVGANVFIPGAHSSILNPSWLHAVYCIEDTGYRILDRGDTGYRIQDRLQDARMQDT